MEDHLCGSKIEGQLAAKHQRPLYLRAPGCHGDLEMLLKALELFLWDSEGKAIVEIAVGVYLWTWVPLHNK